MNYVGDFNCGSTVYIYFNTFDSNDPAASVTMTDFINTDVHIHKDDGLTQRNNAAGITVDVDVDGITGSHFIKIDTSDDTVDNFFKGGHDYFVRIEGVTIDAGTINAVVGHFSLENRMVAGLMQSTDIATLASQTSFTLTAGSADDDAYNNCTCVITSEASNIQKCWGHISDYTGSTKTVTLSADPGIYTIAAEDNITIFAASAQPAADLANATDGLGAIKTETAAILVDTAEIGAAGAGLTAINLPNQTMDITGNLSGSVGSVTGAVGSVTGSVGSNLELGPAEVNAEVVDALNVDTYAEPAQGAPGATVSLATKIGYLYKAFRNRKNQTATTWQLFNDDATTVDHKSTVSDDGTTAEFGEIATGP